ncbi:MAG TPA: hypothetical protein VLV45_03190 [Gemmatimonadales bacterium]|nr:hypothetical protein [Gemmatimonadales bacterium]
MRCVSRFSLLTILGGLLFAAPLAAQYGRGPAGFWLRFGAGYGTANYTCDVCGTGPRIGGITGSLEMGGTLSPTLRLGGFVDGWTNGSGGVAQTMSTVGAALYFYPARASRFYLKGGVGFSTYHESEYAGYDNFGNYYVSPPVTGTGWGFTTGAGVEIPVGRNVSLVPFVDYSWGGIGTLDYADGSLYANQWNQNFASVGLSVAFSSGNRGGRRHRGS